jgi:hypothetical protein
VGALPVGLLAAADEPPEARALAIRLRATAASAILAWAAALTQSAVPRSPALGPVAIQVKQARDRRVKV